jgi:hypothetical protein
VYKYFGSNYGTCPQTRKPSEPFGSTTRGLYATTLKITRRAHSPAKMAEDGSAAALALAPARKTAWCRTCASPPPPSLSPGPPSPLGGGSTSRPPHSPLAIARWPRRRQRPVRLYFNHPKC